jgi:hypothetical protein
VDDRDVTHALLPLKREQQVSARPCRWPQARRLQMQHSETGLLRRSNPPPPQRTAHNVHDFIMVQHAQLMGGTAGEGVLSVRRAELSTAKARSGWSSMGEVGLPKAPPQGGPEVAIREAQLVSSGQGLQAGRRRPARNAPQPGHRLHAGFRGR